MLMVHSYLPCNSITWRTSVQPKTCGELTSKGSQQCKPKRKNSNLPVRQSYQKSQHDQHIRDLPNILEGQRVRVYNPDSSKWSLAVVTQRCVEPRSYIVQTSSGKSLCRNRKHLREVKSALTLNPEASASTPAISPESNGESAVGTTINHSPMEQTSTATTKDRPVPDTPYKTPYTHHGAQNTSRSGCVIRPPRKFNYDENSS